MTKSTAFRKIWTDLHKYNRSMVKKSNKNKTNQNKTNQNKTKKNNKIRKLNGGFIRSGSPQHFYAPCNTNQVVLDKNNLTFQQKMDSVNSQKMETQQKI